MVVVAAAPAVRAAIGEEFGYPIGTNTEGKMFTAMRMLGFDKVFDVNFGADLTIMEEANELLHRVKEGGTLPMFTSCSPGWIRFVEYYYPELIPNLSSCKSPMQMFGATVKTYWAQKEGIDPKNIYVVGVMPCTAKKFERTREHENASGYPDIDAVLTTRELAKMIKNSRHPVQRTARRHLRQPARRIYGRGRHLRRDGRRHGSGAAHRGGRAHRQAAR